VKAQVLGIQSREARGREAAKEREDRSRPSEEDRWREIERSRELGSSQVESPNIGYSKSRGREVAREGQPLDPDHRRTVGSARGIVYRDLARKGPRIWARGSRDCEKAISRQLEDSVGHSRVGEWNTGGTKDPSGSRCEKSRSIGVRIRESRSAEEPRFVWTRGRA
jgi:hypothetical protein